MHKIIFFYFLNNFPTKELLLRPPSHINAQHKYKTCMYFVYFVIFLCVYKIDFFLNFCFCERLSTFCSFLLSLIKYKIYVKNRSNWRVNIATRYITYIVCNIFYLYTLKNVIFVSLMCRGNEETRIIAIIIIAKNEPNAFTVFTVCEHIFRLVRSMFPIWFVLYSTQGNNVMSIPPNTSSTLTFTVNIFSEKKTHYYFSIYLFIYISVSFFNPRVSIRYYNYWNKI